MIWDLITGNCLQTLVAHSGAVNCLIKVTENVIASGSYDNTLKVWNLITRTCVRTLEEDLPIRCLVKINDSRIAIGDTNYNISIWDLTSGKTIKKLEGHEYSVRSHPLLESMKIKL